jgi:SAM-dependent methyltransferase
MDRDDPSYKGQAGYNPFLLAVYDPFVLGFMARAVWRCPILPVVERYRRLIGRRHLDIGPGTGYFLEKAAPPVGTEITLLDPNPNVLAHASRRLAAMDPITVEADVMKPLPVEGRFDSAAFSFVLHCLRGPQSHKAAAIRNIADVLTPDGVLFGGTVLGLAERHTPQARAVLRAFNWHGDFDNLGDTAEGLRRILEESFEAVEVDVIGSTAHFTATDPRPAEERNRLDDRASVAPTDVVSTSARRPGFRLPPNSRGARPSAHASAELRPTEISPFER